MRDIILVTMLICAIFLASVSLSCSSGKRTPQITESITIHISSIAAGTRFAAERELLLHALHTRIHSIEIVHFDKDFTVLEKPASFEAEALLTAKGFSLNLSNEKVSGESFLAVVFDPVRFSYQGSGKNSGEIVNAVSLVANPMPGAVTAGISSVNSAEVTFYAAISLAPGAESTNRITLKAPSGPHNSVDDLTVSINGSEKQLEWTEKNIGDYGNDGEVGIPDITPIALNYGKPVNHSDPSDTAAMIDGDFNGEIGISDITPIALNYLNLVAGYNVYRFQVGGSGWEILGLEPRPAPNPAWRPPANDFADTDAALPVDTFYAVLPVDNDGATGAPSIVVGVPGANDSLKPDPPEGTIGPGNTVNLNEAGVKDITVSPNETLTYDLQFQNADSSYVIALMNPGIPSLAAETVTVGFSGSGTVSSVRTGTSILQTPSQEITPERQLREALRKQEEYLLRNGTKPVFGERKPSAIGDSRNFNIVFADLDPGTIDAVIECRLRAENSRVRIWVDAFVDDGRIPGTLLNEVAADTMNVILDQEESTFGTIYDVDNDSKLDILFTPHINAIPGRVLGLFVSNDLQTSVGTNTMDLIYLHVPDMLDGNPPTVIPPGVFDGSAPVTDVYFENNIRQIIAHELQHLISFGNRLKIRDIQFEMPIPEDLWLNEGLSHFSEDFTGYQGHANLTGTQQYLESAYINPVFWPQQLDGPVVRGGTLLFLRHFYERKGVQAVSEILHRDTPTQAFSGLSNVEQASGESIDKLVREWLGAMSFVGYSVNPQNPYKYNASGPHPETGGKSGMDFLVPYVDYRGLTQYLPRPLTLMLGATPISFEVLPNTAMFVIVPADGETLRRVSLSAGASGLTGVFARVNDGAITKEAAVGPTPFEFFKLYSGRIDSASDTDDFTVLMLDAGTCFIRAVSSAPGEFAPEIRLNGEVYSDVNSMPEVDLKHLLFPPGAGLVTISVSGSGGQTGDYLLSAEFYPE